MVVKVLGARGKISSVEEVMDKAKRFEEEQNCTIQLFRADRIFGALHLTVSVEHAQRAFEQGRNRSKHLGTEILLYSAAERQIKNAIDKLGVTPETESIAVVMVGDAEPDELLAILGLERDDAVLDGEKDAAAFGIKPEEIETADTIDLILEKMALSELER